MRVRNPPGQHIGQAGLTGQVQHAVECPAPDVSVNQQGVIADLGERQGEVRRNERFAVAPARTAHRDHHGAGRPVGVHEVQPDTAQRLDDHGGTVVVPLTVAAHVGHRAQDREPHRLSHLVGVADLGVGTIPDNRTEHRQAQAAEERGQHHKGHRFQHGALGLRRRIEHTHVRNTGGLREERLVIALLHTGEQPLRVRHLAL